MKKEEGVFRDSSLSGLQFSNVSHNDTKNKLEKWCPYYNLSHIWLDLPPPRSGPNFDISVIHTNIRIEFNSLEVSLLQSLQDSVEQKINKEVVWGSGGGGGAV